jgi:single-strand DNA-binding protein
MARGSVNKVILLGNLGGDPEVRYMNNGDAVSSFSVATTEAWKEKISQVRQEQTEWHRIVVYGKLAEIVAKYARKGSHVYIEGRLRTRKWQDQQLVIRMITEVIACEIHILSNRNVVDEHSSGEYEYAAEVSGSSNHYDDYHSEEYPGFS